MANLLLRLLDRFWPQGGFADAPPDGSHVVLSLPGGWQPISTVPRDDGCRIGWQQGPLVLLSDGVQEAAGLWRESFEAFSEETGDEIWWDEGFVDEDCDPLKFVPTRWKPLVESDSGSIL